MVYHRRSTDTDEEARLVPSEYPDMDDSDPPSSALSYPEFRTPKPHAIEPLLPDLQNLPIRLVHRYLPTPTTRRLAATLLPLLWLATFFTPLILATRPVQDGTGHVVTLDCTDSLWPRRECGLDGLNCRPFGNTSFAFRCPADCRGVSVLNPREVGGVEVNYRPLVVGTGEYRGDSFVCGAAIHAGVVSDAYGGCGRVTRVGERTSFPSTEANGIESIPFNSHFPLSYTLSKDPSLTCHPDIRWPLLLTTLPTSIAATLFSTSPSYTFTLVSLVLFAHTAFVSDPPSFQAVDVLPELTSLFARRLLPATFCALAIYRFCVRRALAGCVAQVEKVVLWLGAYWVGVLSNYTFDAIPIQRLTPHDIEQQPGAKLALVIIVAVVALLIAGQVRDLRAEGRLPQYKRIYSVVAAAIVLMALLPGLHLRLHHYVFALLLLPGTAMQTRPSLLYQGLLLGLFANGIARWDFDSVLQTASGLQGDAAFDSLVPKVVPSVSAERLSFKFGAPPSVFDGVTGYVNDVERFRGFFADADGPLRFSWERGDGRKELDEYFRFAFLREGRALDFGGAGVWFANGSYSVPDGDLVVPL